MPKPEKISLDNGKYEVILDPAGGIKALRYGEEWRDCTGDNLIYWMAVEILKLKENK